MAYRLLQSQVFHIATIDEAVKINRCVYTVHMTTLRALPQYRARTLDHRLTTIIGEPQRIFVQRRRQIVSIEILITVDKRCLAILGCVLAGK